MGLEETKMTVNSSLNDLEFGFNQNNFINDMCMFIAFEHEFERDCLMLSTVKSPIIKSMQFFPFLIIYLSLEFCWLLQ